MSRERAETPSWPRGGAIRRALYSDELGDAFQAELGRARLPRQRRRATRSWCDDVRTQYRDLRGLLTASYEAMADLKRRYGEDLKWGEAHVARHRHRPFTCRGGTSSTFAPTGGDAYTVNAGAMDFNDEAEPFANRHAASLRAITDLSDVQSSCSSTPAVSRVTRFPRNTATSPTPGRAASTSP